MRVSNLILYDRKSRPHFQALSNCLKMILFFVMAGLDPAIHVFLAVARDRTWMPGTSPGMTSFDKSAVLLAAFQVRLSG
jgi:hypothetical protein